MEARPSWWKLLTVKKNISRRIQSRINHQQDSFDLWVEVDDVCRIQNPDSYHSVTMRKPTAVHVSLYIQKSRLHSSFTRKMKSFKNHFIPLAAVGLVVLTDACAAFSLPQTSTTSLQSASGSTEPTITDNLLDLKIKLVNLCTQNSKPSGMEVEDCVRSLEESAEVMGMGQSSSFSGLLNGEWELLYSPEDITRSSPFFWAFEKAFPDNADQIFSITDAIPSPIKDVGPAIQAISMDENQIGTLVSRVKVATLNGMATSIMTTKAKIIGTKGFDGLELQVETTQPKDSTVVNTLLGPLASVVESNLPAFPSGEALERVSPGSSRVVMKTTFCDETLRISRNADEPNGIYVWTRTSFGAPVGSL